MMAKGLDELEALAAEALGSGSLEAVAAFHRAANALTDALFPPEAPLGVLPPLRERGWWWWRRWE